MYNNLKNLINLKKTIFKNKRLIIVIQFIAIFFAIIYFYNTNTNYNYSTRYQNPYSEILTNGNYTKQTNDLQYSPKANFFQLDYYYNYIFSEDFDLTETIKQFE